MIFLTKSYRQKVLVVLLLPSKYSPTLPKAEESYYYDIVALARQRPTLPGGTIYLAFIMVFIRP